ncbi:Reversal of tor2 lethality [Serendipita sp. 396]|nr:Reversal of tor2 lethality [Serendipita sp. 396]KAG8787037.1 Reversal of tor2 lethality [Serendipita sp. 397]KAG8815749.1 Reversal of tor2 lethality [Serendipita sp. 401]KAG8847425.1 Reversal of tor2 lethality [Serendipita sp. 405]
MRTALFTVLAALISRVIAQGEDVESIGEEIVYDNIHNFTTIEGTWSSGSRKVLTGVQSDGQFCNPVDSTFTYPQTAGLGYSFTNDGWFEEALYRFQGNGTDPRCVVGVVQWQHGRVQYLQNGSIVLHPWPQDGRQQIQNPCAAESNILRQFNQTTLFKSWRIFRDPEGRAKLHLFRFDGAPFPPLFQVSDSPSMLPLRQLTNTTVGSQATKKRSLADQVTEPLQKRSAASPLYDSHAVTLSAAAGLVALGLMSMV